MLKEQQGAVGCAGRACGKPSVGILRFAGHKLLLALPGYAEGRIGDHIIELLAGEPVFAQRGAELDVIGVLARYKEVRFADGIGLRIEFLSVNLDIYLRIDMLQNPVLSDREHSAGTAARIEQRTDLSLPAKVIRSP